MSKDIKQRFWKELADNPYLMVALDAGHAHAIPMTAQLDKDNDGYFHFFHAKSGRLAAGGRAMAQYVAKGHDLFACVSGTLTPVTDRATIDKYWSKPVEAWYEGGKDDPHIVFLRMDLGRAEIWDGDMSLLNVAKMALGMYVHDEAEEKHVKQTSL